MLQVIQRGAEQAARVADRFVVGCESDDCTANPQAAGGSVDEAWARWHRRAPYATSSFFILRTSTSREACQAS